MKKSLFVMALSIIGMLSAYEISEDSLVLDSALASELARLPLTCYNQEYPYKDGYVVENATQFKHSKENHPIFYGCFDWHSSVHGHWLLATLRRRFPNNTDLTQQVDQIFDQQFTVEKVEREVEFFSHQKSYERTYGWVWLLKLQLELLELEEEYGKKWSLILEPLADLIVSKYKEFLPKLVYPVRVGTHTNSAFGLIFAYEYANYTNDTELMSIIEETAKRHYAQDKDCPLTWEPSGTDFLSPCLQEVDLMSRLVGDHAEFGVWIDTFKKDLVDINLNENLLEPGKVSDASDGHLVHLYGLNFSRAWNIYSLVIKISATSKAMERPDMRYAFKQIRDNLLRLADKHVMASMGQVLDSEYSGSHWLATFLSYALIRREEALHSLSNLDM